MALSLRRVLISGLWKSQYQQIRGIKRWMAPTLKALKSKKLKEPQPVIYRSSLIEWNYKAELFAFSKRLGEDFDYDLLQQALTTREYVLHETEEQTAVGIENPEIDLVDNRRYTDVGHKIIDNYVLRYLRTVFPKFPEEGIHEVKQYLTSNEQLAMIASNIGINDLVLTPNMPPDQLTLVNSFKAVVAALAESSGLDQANLFVRDFIITHLAGKSVSDLWEIKNPIEVLSDVFSRDGKPAVEYRLIGEAGRNTILAAYQVGVYLNKQFLGIGLGESIPIAKEMAARDVLRQMFNVTDSSKPISFDLKLTSDSSEPFANLSIKDWCETNIDKLNKKTV